MTKVNIIQANHNWSKISYQELGVMHLSIIRYKIQVCMILAVDTYYQPGINRLH